MVNLKTLLTNIVKMLGGITTGTLDTTDITVTKGTLIYAAYAKWGPVVQLYIQFRNTSSVAAGTNFFESTLNRTDLLPTTGEIVTNNSYYSSYAVGVNLSSTGTLNIHNCSTVAVTIGSSNSCIVNLVYFVF